MVLWERRESRFSLSTPAIAPALPQTFPPRRYNPRMSFDERMP